MKVELLHATPLSVAIHATRTCYDSFDKSDNGGEKDQALMNRVIVSHNHGSVYEHCHFNFFLEGVTRGTLQELVRHRHSFQDMDFPEWDGRDWSPSVRSSRYTLKELKNEQSFYDSDSINPDGLNYDRAYKYIAHSENHLVNKNAVKQLELLREAIISGIPNDIAKDLIPDCYLTDITMTINGRSLRNLIKLRTSKSAYWRIRELAKKIYNAIPEEHKFLFDDVNQSNDIVFDNEINMNAGNKDDFTYHINGQTHIINQDSLWRQTGKASAKPKTFNELCAYYLSINATLNFDGECLIFNFREHDGCHQKEDREEIYKRVLRDECKQ